MNRRLLNRFARPAPILALVVAVAMLCCGGTAATLFLGSLNKQLETGPTVGSGCGSDAVIAANGKLPRLGQLDDDQMRNAAIIVEVGRKMQVPPRGWVVAVATAMQESVLRNLPNLGTRNDHDSIGLFQQRPSQGWGSVDQLLNPRYAAQKFYKKLLTVPGWQNMALTDAAQAVQRSAYPDAYAKHEPLATQVVNALTGGAARAVGSLAKLRCANPGEISASGWTIPVRGSIVSGFRTPQRPEHNGVDLAVPKGTIVRAASAGIVLTARCNAHTADGTPYSCDRDGSVSIIGCGWYVDILHAGNVITRYCHMVSRPDVVPGQRVAAGEQIGHSGTSGNSSGPHLHFEVHVGGDESPSGAINPLPYMNGVGASLGGQP
jgi:murein DD-endopeptidase MepM/ murein hydrolase activator NlpD